MWLWFSDRFFPVCTRTRVRSPVLEEEKDFPWLHLYKRPLSLCITSHNDIYQYTHKSTPTALLFFVTATFNIFLSLFFLLRKRSSVLQGRNYVFNQAESLAEIHAT